MEEKKIKNNVIVSACLLGIPCRYDGKGKPSNKATSSFLKGEAFGLCPEVLGGLPTPRPACEIYGGDGKDVLCGKAKVIDADGNDYTKQFVDGAREAVKRAKALGATRAILKSRSPSCGSCTIYDGTFSSKTKVGKGVFAAALEEEGVLIEEV